MPGIAIRELECELCRRRFARLTGDFIVPGDEICDECLVEIGRLEGETLGEFVSRQLATNYPEYEEKKRKNIFQNVQWFKTSLPSDTDVRP